MVDPHEALEEARVIAYVGQTRSSRLIALLRGEGIGECAQPNEFPPRRLPWMFDNGAYAAWKAGAPFDAGRWAAALDRVVVEGPAPAFAVAPDVVAGGLASIELSMAWVGQLRAAKIPAYLAVQNGMPEATVRAAVLEGFSGLFVGGTLEWKLATGARWVQVAHELGLPCHVGRVGTAGRVEWAAEIGADSIDSCLPLWSMAKFDRFVNAMRRARRQHMLFGEGS